MVISIGLHNEHMTSYVDFHNIAFKLNVTEQAIACNLSKLYSMYHLPELRQRTCHLSDQVLFHFNHKTLS